jgi:hypothetical protein
VNTRHTVEATIARSDLPLDVTLSAARRFLPNWSTSVPREAARRTSALAFDGILDHVLQLRIRPLSSN